MTYRRQPVVCDDFEDRSVDLAVGSVAEPERTALLGHTAICTRCEQLLRDVIAVTDRLVELAPEIDPPAGFESRAVARMGGTAGTRLSRRRNVGSAAAAAAAIVVALAVGVTAGLVAGGRSSGAATPVVGEVLTVEGDRSGTVELWESGYPHMVIVMDRQTAWFGQWTCELQVDGEWVTVASWTSREVSDRVWATGIGSDLADATRMRIRNDRGKVIAVAEFARD